MSILKSCYGNAKAFSHVLALAPQWLGKVARQPMSTGDRYFNLTATYTRGYN
ncbi:MAG: hypothetical protein OXI44_03680 [Bacteroidota bacterium]|nr:hypothetical protein [Bacteroidota bacterium]